MADRAVALSGKTGLFAAALVAGLILAALVAVFMAADVAAGLGAADWAAVRFTVTQAVWSAVLSVLLARAAWLSLCNLDHLGHWRSQMLRRLLALLARWLRSTRPFLGARQVCVALTWRRLL